MAVRSDPDPGIVDAIKIDLQELHDAWMALIFPRQRQSAHSVLGKWKPRTTSGRFAYRGWSTVGTIIVTILYPFVLLGYITRFYTRKLDRTATSLGFFGVILITAVIWGSLTLVAHLRYTDQGFLAVAAAAVIATISAGLAVIFTRVGGRGTTIFLAYPMAMNALFLPPVVAAFFDPYLATVIFPRSEALAIWILDNILHVYGINEMLRQRYTLEGIAYIGMWFGIAVPIGWALGILVTLADIVRPKRKKDKPESKADPT